MKRLINQARHPVPLEDGTILAAAGTEGSAKTVETISDADRSRYVGSGLVAQQDLPAEAAQSQVAPARAAQTRKQEGAS